MTTYRTVQGDMWDSIAYRKMGSCLHTSLLMNANRQYHDIFIFPAGIELVIPEVPAPIENTLPPWKRVTA